MESSDAMADPTPSRFEIDFYQLVDDTMLAKNRGDGCGFDFRWADVRRKWMDDTTNGFAYRCLPLTIANQLGWHVTCPVGFTAFWRGGLGPGSVDFKFDHHPEHWKNWINDQFGQGIITWNTPFLIRTKPAGSRLLVLGPANFFRRHAHPLTALIETDWMTASFTMNYKLMEECEPIRFEAGEPLMQLIPVANDIGSDLEHAKVTYRRLVDDPETFEKYDQWSKGRTQFHEEKRKGNVKPDEWQKDYFLGKEAKTTRHVTKLKPPAIDYRGGTGTRTAPQTPPQKSR
ncbi:MAG: DUF6065 family protein [Tepidisphaeraceae bacterium]